MKKVNIIKAIAQKENITFIKMTNLKKSMNFMTNTTKAAKKKNMEDLKRRNITIKYIIIFSYA